MTRTLSPNTLTRPDALAARSDRYNALIRDSAMDASGIVRANVWFDPIRPLRAGDLPPSSSLLDTVAPEDLYAYEDAGMASGAYLASQAIRYRVTADADALDDAGAVYRGIRRVYELGAAHKTGVFPKPYGGRYSEQISRDQYLFAMFGLAEYLTVAPPDLRPEIVEMLGSMARHWIDLDYSTRYFNLPRSNHLRDFMGSLYLGILAVAARATDDAALWDEYKRLRDVERLGPRMAETHASHFRAGNTYDGGTYYRQSENAVMMKAMATDLLYACDAEHREWWDRAMRAFWADDLLVPLDEQTGMNYFVVGYDPASDGTYLTEPRVISELENPLNLSFLNWGGLRQSAGSTQSAFAAVLIADRLGLPAAQEVAESILTKLTPERFRGMTAPDERHIPPGHAFELDLLNTGYVAYWLWAYWSLRERFGGGPTR